MCIRDRGKDVTVDVVYSGTASGADYSFSTNSVTIPAGSTSSNIVITGLDDCEDDDGETVIVDIDNVVNGLEDTPNQVTAVIVDDEETPTGITMDSQDIDENGSSPFSVGNFTTADGNPLDTHVYSLVVGLGDDDNASFTIVGAELRATATFNHEVQDTYLIRVRTTDPCALFFDCLLYTSDAADE